MGYVSDGKWTCPYAGCGQTISVSGSPDDERAALYACQRRHAAIHRATAATFARLILEQRQAE